MAMRNPLGVVMAKSHLWRSYVFIEPPQTDPKKGPGAGIFTYMTGWYLYIYICWEQKWLCAVDISFDGQVIVDFFKKNAMAPRLKSPGGRSLRPDWKQKTSKNTRESRNFEFVPRVRTHRFTKGSLKMKQIEKERKVNPELTLFESQSLWVSLKFHSFPWLFCG